MVFAFDFGPLLMSWEIDADPRWDEFRRAYADYAGEGTPGLRGFYELVRHAADGWDGTDPVRTLR